MPICRARRKIFGLVNQNAADMAVLAQQATQFFQHLLIGEFPAASQNDFLRFEKLLRLDDALKYAIGSNPLVPVDFPHA